MHNKNYNFVKAVKLILINYNSIATQMHAIVLAISPNSMTKKLHK